MCPIRRQQTPLEIPSPAGSAPLLSARCQPGSEKEKTRRMKKEMLINVLQPEECRIAIVEDGVLEELYVERTSLESFTGNIYKGRIVNLEPAIQAAFVDFSVGRNGFLHVSDVEPQYYERGFGDEPETPSREGDRDRGRGRGREPHETAIVPAKNPDPPAEAKIEAEAISMPVKIGPATARSPDPRVTGASIGTSTGTAPTAPRKAGKTVPAASEKA